MNAAPHILLIDDDQNILRIAAALIQQEFPSAQVATIEAAQGLAQAMEAGQFDLVVTDYRLGWTDGLTILRMVKARAPDCPVIMFTATGSEEVAVEAMKAGLDDYVLKAPHHIHRLPTTIRMVLEQTAQRRQLTQAHTALRESQERLVALIDSAMDAIITTDREQRILSFNGAAEAMFRCPAATVIGHSLNQLIPARFRAAHRARIRDFDQSGQTTWAMNRMGEIYGLRADGTEFPLEASLSKGAIGGQIFYTAIVRDLTERRQAEAKIQALARFPDENPQPVLRVAADGELRYANKASRPLLEDWGCVPGGRVPEPWREHVAAVLAQGMPTEREVIVGERTFVLLLVPVVEPGYVNLYGSDITDRKRAEDTLSQREAWFRSILEHAPDFISVLDAAGRIRYASPSVLRALGFAQEELLGSMAVDLLHPDDRPQASATLVQALQAPGITHSVEARVRTREGQWRVWEIVGSAIHDLSEGTRVILNARDITERKQAQEALTLFRTLIDHANDMIEIVDLTTGRVHDVNEQALQTLGYTREEYLALTVLDIAPGMTAQLYEEYTQQLRRAGSCVLETSHRRKDGSVFPVEVSLTYFRQDRDYVLAVTRDITERKRAEDALRDSEQRFRVFVETSPDTIFINKLSCDQLIYINAAGVRLLGATSADQILGKSVFQFVHPTFHAIVHDRITRFTALNTPMPWLEEKFVRLDGTPVDVEVTAVPVHYLDERMDFVILHDITARKELEVRANRLERLAAIGQLLGGIAHELRNPLFVLTGRLQLFREKLRQQEYTTLPTDLQTIETAAHRMREITDRFLFMAKPYEPRQEVCAIQTVLTTTLHFLGNELMKNQIQVKTAFGPDLPTIRSDPRQLQQVFLNLMLNAMQAMVAAHGQGTLTVSAQGSPPDSQPAVAEQGQPGTWIEVRIQDDGPGIAPEHQARLFEPFFSTKPAGEGTGLGLWTVRTMVAALQGTVTYETEVGRGTTFIVRLPVTEVSHQPSASSEAP